MSVRVYLFGAPRIAQSDGLVALSFERRSQLLAHLALRRSRVGRTDLAALLWPQTPVEQAQVNLRKTLFRLRTLPWAPAVAEHDNTLLFDGTSDVADFESALKQRRWSAAMQIADAPLLAGFDDDASEPWSDWLRTERERLRTAWRGAAGKCLADASDAADALELSSRLLANDPIDEPALRAQMDAYIRLGKPARARDAYQAYAAQLADDIGVAPSADLRQLYATLASSGRSTGGHMDHGEHGLVGRNAEQREIRMRLARGDRLLSLVGPGGVGKSALARHLQTELAPRYSDGSAYIPLEDVPSADMLGTRLARELAVPLGGSADPMQSVTACLRQRRMLLVLDNFEHLQAAAPRLQTLLDACPHVQMLVTSRARLDLAAEQLIALDGLPCPDAEDIDRLETFDAARLFMRAASASGSAIQPAGVAAAIAEICRLVDGLPLALEMAAAWTQVLSCAAIAADLRQGVALLTGMDAARPARHASMATVFEHSWQRLSPDERSTWPLLTAFRGGFTLQAACAVTGATLTMLAALTDQSLLRKSGERIDLHPLLRQLAAARLTDDGRAACNAAHAAYYLQWLAPLRSGLFRGDKQALQQVEVEFENVRAAWRWACAHGPTEALQSTALLLMRFCDLRGRWPEGLALLREARSGVGAGDTRLAALLDAASAHLECRVDNYAGAQMLAENALLATRDTRDHDTRLQCFKVLGHCALEMGRFPVARRRYRQALAQGPAAIDPRNAAAMLQNLATLESALGRYDAARPLYMRSLLEFRRLRDACGEAICRVALGALELDADQVDTAADHLQAGLALCEQQALTSWKMWALEGLTELSVRRHDADAAQRYGELALELARQSGTRDLQSAVQLHFAHLAMQQPDLAAARAALRSAVECAIGVDYVPRQLSCVLCFANLLCTQGEADAANRLWHYVIDHPASWPRTRNRARQRLSQGAASLADAAAPANPTLDLKTLLDRITGETPAAHAPLIESLRPY